MAGLHDSYISGSEAAAILGLRPYGIQKLIHRGQLPAEKIANRWLLLRAVVEEFAKTYEPRRDRPRRKLKHTSRQI